MTGKGNFSGLKLVELKDIKAIIDLMKKNSVSEFELEKQDFKIRLKRGVTGGGPVVQYEDAPAAVYPNPVPAIPVGTGTAPTGSTAPAAANEVEIKSPMIGTFYRTPSPESASYVEVGTEVNPDTVVCIIEAMKVMNEIKAEVKGVITQVLVENAKPVEFGQPLFKVRSA
ncbi:MAG: acetyl-CoA carboxylase, biotin carboxyl carrier protein [Deltaproteobacteria bacterium]|nr:acetyl-CoA carboxylase, biotin carboxyl carrier protein [Deltaproteobacteria bacterium]